MLLTFLTSSYRPASTYRNMQVASANPSTSIPTTIVSSVRCSSAQLKRAAGSQSLETLRSALLGWTVTDVDGMAQDVDASGGKGPLHMAAWQGCVENLTHLLDDWGCDVNVIARGEFSYGKTPIFFAATQSRADILLFLLDRGAHVKIVNNKGQSIRSIAASHFEDPTIIDRIIQAEIGQANSPWRNYRETHGDGLEYGDLDPRFLDRPLRETDTVTAWAINPTTKQSRKGGFLRRNPDLAMVKNQRQAAAERKRRPIAASPIPSLTANEICVLEQSWQSIEKTCGTNGLTTAGTLFQDCTDDFWTIVELNDKLRQSWIPSFVSRLSSVSGHRSLWKEWMQLVRPTSDMRQRKLIDKIVAQLTIDRSSDAAINRIGAIESNNRLEFQQRSLPKFIPPSLTSEPWKTACEAVQGLTISYYCDEATNVLQLPNQPVWIDAVEEMGRLRKTLATCTVVAIDTEWYTNPVDGSTCLATIQVAIRRTNAGDPNDSQILSWVVDLIGTRYEAERRERYVEGCRDLVEELLENYVVLGFAVGHDLHILAEWVARPFNTNRVLDLQRLWASKAMPGLAACVERYAVIESNCENECDIKRYCLSKDEQCSEWNRRPLTSSQIEYAGLDAAILITLLAERYREEQQEVGKGG
jgi:hypothetical protein